MKTVSPMGVRLGPEDVAELVWRLRYLRCLSQGHGPSSLFYPEGTTCGVYRVLRSMIDPLLINDRFAEPWRRP